MPIEDTRPPDQRLRDAGIVYLLQKVWSLPVTTKSDDARSFADEIAEASSRQLLTTAIVPSKAGRLFGRIWKITPQGLQFLWENADLLCLEEDRYVQAHCV